MSLGQYTCGNPDCARVFLREKGQARRTLRNGGVVYCSMPCAGAVRRDAAPPSDSERRAAKSDYDRRRRAALGEAGRAAKRAAYYRDHEINLERQAEVRQRPGYRERHRAYLDAYTAAPAWKAHKRAYDIRRRADKDYGPMADAYLALRDLESEIAEHMTREEIAAENGTLNKKLNRRRQWLRESST